jgi:hypothetical protein
MIELIDRERLAPSTASRVQAHDYKSHRLTDVDGSKSEFVSCDFSYCIVLRGYFRDSVFKNCKFVGTRFTECNFRLAVFENCDFSYAQFDKTLLPVENVLSNLPSYPNVRREFLQNLRANIRSVGELHYDAALVWREVDAEREHWRLVRTRPDAYHRAKYSTLRDQYIAWLNSARLVLDRHVWGHGESLWRLIAFTVTTLVLLALIRMSLVDGLDSAAPLGTLWQRVLDNAKFVFALYMDLPTVDQRLVNNSLVISYLTIAFRYLSFGLLVSIWYKHITRR